MHEYCLSSKSEEEEKIQNSHALYGRNIGYAYTGDFNSTIGLNIILLGLLALYKKSNKITDFVIFFSNELVMKLLFLVSNNNDKLQFSRTNNEIVCYFFRYSVDIKLF